MSKGFRRASSRRNINLLLYQWVALDRVAQSTGSLCTRGTRKGNRSWRCLLRRIAEGELVVIPRVVAQEAKVLPVAPELEFIGPPMKRKPGRPIPLDREPVPMPADWALTHSGDSVKTAA